MVTYTEEEVEFARKTREDIVNYKKDFLLNIFRAGEIYSWAEIHGHTIKQKDKRDLS